jgi:glycosyltransferase involved in cell wall biosynthesis
MKKVLMAVGWEVQPVKEDDQRKHPADLLLPDQRYWFFKHWQEDNSKIDVMGYKKIPLLSKIEKKFLHFHLFQSLRVLYKMKKYDLLIFFHSQIGLTPALFKSIFRIKTPLVLIDVEGLGRKNQWFVRPFIRKALQGIDRLFYLAAIQKEDYQRYYPEIIDKSEFLPLGIDLTRFSSNGAKEEDYIVSIGYQSSDFRDWKTLLKAYGQLKTKARLLILGKERFDSEETENESIPEGVRFIGKTDLSTLNEITSKAKFVVLPLPERRHAFGQMTLLGCMALGKGVIVSKVSSVTDYLKDKEDGILYEPYNPDDLAEKMNLLLGNPKLAIKLGRKAQLTVKKNYSEPLMAQKIRESLVSEGLIADSISLPSAEALPVSKNVLLLGRGFYLHNKNGDKNFWLNLCRELSPMLDRLIIVSVNALPGKFEQEGNIFQYNFPLSFHPNNGREWGLRLKFLMKSPSCRAVLRSITLIKLIPFLRKIIKQHRIETIHLMDNFGFLTGLLKLFFPELKVYATAITYNTHGFPSSLYTFYQKIVFGKLDRVAVSSKAYRDELIRHGFPDEKVEIIRWGVPLGNGNRGSSGKRKTSLRKKVILWTGFTQQIKEKSFFQSLAVARSIVRKNPSVDFVFAFKQECFQDEYGLYREKNLKVIKTDRQEFLKLLGKTDLLLAPVETSGSTIAPPLSWIECMSRGIPVMSTQAPGAEEVLKNNLTGFVAKSNHELGDMIEKVVEDKKLLKEVSGNARGWVRENYNLKDIAEDYLKFWGGK